jgi:ribosomal protein L9
MAQTPININQHNKNVDEKQEQQNRKSQPRQATNEEILNHTTNLIDSIGSAAESFGQEGAKDLANKTTTAIKSIPVAVNGIKREIEPVKKSVSGLWDALKSRGYVGNREKMNIAEMQGRMRNK